MYHRWGGGQNSFREGFYGMFSPSLSFHPPLFFSDASLRIFVVILDGFGNCTSPGKEDTFMELLVDFVRVVTNSHFRLFTT